MIRSIRQILAPAAFAIGLMGAPMALADVEMPAQAPLTLRSTVLVEDSVIRLGDLFDGTLANGETAVARAPAPGGSVVLDAHWLSALARTYGLSWRPASRFEQSVVGRASQKIGATEIKQALRTALADRGIDGAIDLALDAGDVGFHLPVDVAPTVKVQKLSLDSASGRFAAVVVAPADGPASAQGAVSGRVFTLAEVPVPARRLAPGDIIGQADLEWTQLRTDRIMPTTVVDPAQLIGKSPRRPLRPGEPIRNTDVERAVAVEKGAIVTVVLESAQMSLTIRGRAMEDGAEGDVIRVMNTSSNRIVQATVANAGTVIVGGGFNGGSAVIN